MLGTLIIIGLMSGTVAEKVNIGPILRNRLNIRGSTLRARSPSPRYFFIMMPHLPSIPVIQRFLFLLLSVRILTFISGHWNIRLT